MGVGPPMTSWAHGLATFRQGSWAAGVGLLVEALQSGVRDLHARATADGSAADHADSVWQASMTLSALWHTCQGQLPGDATASSSASAAAAAQEAFFSAEGPSCCVSTLAALGSSWQHPSAASTTVVLSLRCSRGGGSARGGEVGLSVHASVHPTHAPTPPAQRVRQAEALSVLKAILALWHAATRAQPTLNRCLWHALGGVHLEDDLPPSFTPPPPLPPPPLPPPFYPPPHKPLSEPPIEPPIEPHPPLNDLPRPPPLEVRVASLLHSAEWTL